MDYYSKDQTDKIGTHHFAFINVEITDRVLTITLNRPQKRNALHPQMVNELCFAMQYAFYNTEVWIIVLRAKGSVFCAGADLKAMAGIIEEHDSTIPLPSGEVLIGTLFNKVYKPSIAVVTGDVYAGGFFFLAGCHIIIALDHVLFGLPEVKRGLFPFQVMEALMLVMPARKVMDWCIRGYKMTGSDAYHYGLVSELVNEGDMEERLAKIINEIKENSPKAISMGLEAFDHIAPRADTQQYLYDMLQRTISSDDGQEGLAAFRERRKPKWTGR